MSISLSLLIAVSITAIAAVDDLFVCNSALSSTTWASLTSTQLFNWGSVTKAVPADDGTSTIYFGTSANNFYATKVNVYDGVDHTNTLYSLPRNPNEAGAIGASVGGMWLNPAGDSLYVYNKLNSVESFDGSKDLVAKVKISDKTKTILLNADTANLNYAYATDSKLSYPLDLVVDMATDLASLFVKDNSGNLLLIQCTLGGTDCDNLVAADAVATITLTGSNPYFIGSTIDADSGTIFWATMDNQYVAAPVLTIFSRTSGASSTTATIYTGIITGNELSMSVIRTKLYVVCRYGCPTDKFIRMDLDGSAAENWSSIPDGIEDPLCIAGTSSSDPADSDTDSDVVTSGASHAGTFGVAAALIVTAGLWSMIQ